LKCERKATSSRHWSLEKTTSKVRIWASWCLRQNWFRDRAEKRSWEWKTSCFRRNGM